MILNNGLKDKRILSTETLLVANRAGVARRLQGNLAQKKAPHPLRTTIGPEAQPSCRVV